jgi:hypothetical protein
MPFYNFYKFCAFDQAVAVDLKSDTIKCALCTATYTPDIDADAYWDDVTNEVASGGGYTTGGETLANKAVTQDNTNDRAVWDADDVTWSNSTITARYAVLYHATGTASTSTLICYFDFGSSKSSSNADFTIQWNATGIATLT